MQGNTTKTRVALVTGGGQGIGRGIALHLAANGCTVVIFDLDAEAAIETAHEANGRIVPLVGDVSDEAAVADLLAQIDRDFGRLDGLVNNAGIAGPFTGPLEELQLADWNRVLAVNLTGAFLLCKHAAPLLRQSRGAIVNIASTRALQSEAHTEAYSASKGGIVGMTLPLARDLAQWGVRVVTVAPGLFMTPLMKQLPEPVQVSLAASIPFPKRLGKPEEFASLAAHIVTNTHLNGEVIRLDGALRMAPR